MSVAEIEEQHPQTKAEAALEFAQQSERLGQYTHDQEEDRNGSTQAVKATFITAQDPVITTADGGRLPAVPVDEALQLNGLGEKLGIIDSSEKFPDTCETRESKDGTVHGVLLQQHQAEDESETNAPLAGNVPASRTNPLFPPMPLYGPPTPMRNAQIIFFRISSAILSFLFLLVIILGAGFTSVPGACKHAWMRWNGQNPEALRPFHEEEKRRVKARKAMDEAWVRSKNEHYGEKEANGLSKSTERKGNAEFPPLEGGPDPIICDIRYYARRIGLDCEIFDVQTEDGFIIELWHIYDPSEYKRTDASHRSPRKPEVFSDSSSDTDSSTTEEQYPPGKKKYPVLMIHGLLQSAGAYCTNDDDSLAFFLAKSGYDVWLGNNRCGFNPRHQKLDYADPRMWAWNIRQMGVMDLPALVSRVLSETGFEKLGLIAHSQGTTQTLVALAKEQRPELGDKLSVFCALAPAAYAGPLIGKAYFKFMRVINPGMFRLIFGIHAFIPLMMEMHKLLPSRLYGSMGYRVFAFLFNWTDERWDRGLRDRMFQFAPVYVSAESMRWWLGRECFARHKCILATREEKKIEDREDAREDRDRERLKEEWQDSESEDSSSSSDEETEDSGYDSTEHTPPAQEKEEEKHPLLNRSHTEVKKQKRRSDSDRARFSWYGPRTPPFAFWVCGSDDLVDGRRLLRRFERGREPYVDVVHSKIIDGYEHLDVIWAMDMIEQVGKEVREVLWKTAPEEARKLCRVPRGCEGVGDFYVPGEKVGERKKNKEGEEAKEEQKEEMVEGVEKEVRVE